MTKSRAYRGFAQMSESDYIDVLNKLFIYTVRLVIYAKVCQDVVCIYQALNFLI